MCEAHDAGTYLVAVLDKMGQDGESLPSAIRIERGREA
jgi:hypothetical protein